MSNGSMTDSIAELTSVGKRPPRLLSAGRAGRGQRGIAVGSCVECILHFRRRLAAFSADLVDLLVFRDLAECRIEMGWSDSVDA